MSLTLPSERTRTIMRWGACFGVVLLAHVALVVKWVKQSDYATALPDAQIVELDADPGEPRIYVPTTLYAPPKPIEQEVRPQPEAEQTEAEVVLPKEEQQPEPLTPRQPAQKMVEQLPKAPPRVTPDMVRKWRETVSTRLNQFKRYPPEARVRHQEGKGTVEFQLDPDGRVVSSNLLKSSGSAILDKEILDLVSRAQPFPVPPNGAGGQDLI